MIPVCNRTTYLRKTLDSVLSQALAGEDMQICIVDNSSEPIDWAAWLTEAERSRVETFVQPSQVPLAENWNTCIRKATGFLVHILHDDDWVLDGFYRTLQAAADAHEDIALFASRSIYVTPQEHAIDITPRLDSLRSRPRDAEGFYYSNRLQCPGVAVRRAFYETFGGFRHDLHHCLDWEMWVRAIAAGGGWGTEHALASYRFYPEQMSQSQRRTAANLSDVEHLFQIMAGQHATFSSASALASLLTMARQQEITFRNVGDAEAAEAALDFWQARAPFSVRVRRLLGQFKRTFTASTVRL